MAGTGSRGKSLPAGARRSTGEGGRPTPDADAAPIRTGRALAQSQTYVALIRAAHELERAFVELLKPADLSVTQYNVLRILRGAGAAGLTCNQIGGRLIRHDPDVTRLLDRLERRGLIARERDQADRRIVRTRIAPAGQDLLATFDDRIDAVHDAQFDRLSDRELAQFRKLADAMASARSS